MNFVYERQINYYETDKMGVVHHSNYIRYLEEARCKWLEELGIPYDKFEENGIMIPVLEVRCEHKYHVTFGDTIRINLKIKKYTGVRLEVEYEITNVKDNKLVFLGETKHCFTNTDLKPVNLKKYNIEFSNKFEE